METGPLSFRRLHTNTTESMVSEHNNVNYIKEVMIHVLLS